MYNKGYDTIFSEYAYGFIEKKHSGNAETKKGMKNSISKFINFAGNASFGAINKQLLEKYRSHCINDLKNKESTADKSLKNVGTIINAAIEEGIITDNPVKKIKFKEHDGKKESLSIDEFRLLLGYFNDNDNLSIKRKETLRAFLFACCTGLRWGDIYSLKFENIKDNRIILTEHKTQKKRDVIVMSSALQFIDFDKKYSEYQNIFDLPAGQTTNKQLKLFAKEINKKEEQKVISEKITFHYSRRTLSTLLYNTTGSIDLTADIVGNTPEVNKKHYSKILDKKKINVLNELDIEMFGK